MYANTPYTVAPTIDHEIVLGQIRRIEDCVYFSSGMIDDTPLFPAIFHSLLEIEEMIEDGGFAASPGLWDDVIDNLTDLEIQALAFRDAELAHEISKLKESLDSENHMGVFHLEVA